MKLDIHVHSSFSNDGTVSPEDILKYAMKIKLDGIAITDHNEIKGALKLWKDNKSRNDFVVIPGMEISSEKGHILALGIKDSVPRDLSPEETIEKITELGGLPIAPHPFRFWSGLGKESVKKSGFKAIEVLNSRSLKKENKKADRLAEELGCGKTGGSDCHSLTHLGNAYTIIENPVFDIDDIIDEIRKKRTKGQGKSRSPLETPRYAASCVYLWLKRGMKRI